MEGAVYLLDDPQGGGFEDTPVLGEPAVLELMRRAPEAGYANAILLRATTGLLLLVAGLTAAALWPIVRPRLFLWLAGWLLSAGAYSLLWLPPIRFGWSAQADQVATLLFGSGGEPFLWYLFLTIFGLNVSRGWRRATAVVTVVFGGAVVGDCMVVLLWAHAGAGLRWTDDVLSWMMTVVPLYSLLIVAVGLRSRRPLAIWPLAAAVVVTELYGFAVTVSQQFINLGSNLFAMLTRPHLVLGPYSMSIHTLAALAAADGAGVGDAVGARGAAGAAAGGGAGDSWVLHSDGVPACGGGGRGLLSGNPDRRRVPGGDRRCEREGDGGGDDGVADCGDLRTLAEMESAPAAVLTRLNRRLLGRTAGGFTTCLAMHVTEDGGVLVATAGHPSPYWNECELKLPMTLPLGITADLEVEERTERLELGDRLTFYTDGLPEARNDKGELYGFDRVAQLLADGPLAEEIVAAARNFGQEDDITVLTLTRSGSKTGRVSSRS